MEEAERELRDYGRRHPFALKKLTKPMLGIDLIDDDARYLQLANEVPLLELQPVERV